VERLKHFWRESVNGYPLRVRFAQGHVESGKVHVFGKDQEIAILAAARGGGDRVESSLVIPPRRESRYPGEIQGEDLRAFSLNALQL